MPRAEINKRLPIEADAMPERSHGAALARGAAAIGAIDAVIGRIVETLAGLLVALETLILFAGVVARYVVRAPLVWSDELASILFLWLAMLGAVIAYRRAEHMRMSALIDKAAPGRRAFFEVLALCVGLTFLGFVLKPAIEYAVDEAAVVTPALEISTVWRAAALPVGIGLMLLSGLARIGKSARLAHLALAVALIAGVSLGLMLAGPSLSALGNYKLILFFVLLTGSTVLAGVPIAFAFGIGTFAFLASTTRLPMTVVIGRLDEGMSHIILLAVPLFVFLGLLIEITGLARYMVGFLACLIGHVRGGLQYVLLAAMYLVSGISGSKAADMAAVAPVLFPEMRARGAKGGDLVALLAATGAQTETIPPSLVLITIGSVTGVSISAMFTGGLLPGAVMAVMLAGVVWWRNRDAPVSIAQRASGAQTLRVFAAALPGLILPFVIRAAVVEGVATATEVSTIGVIYGLVYGSSVSTIGVIYGLVYGSSRSISRPKIAWHRVWPALVDTAALSGAILFIIGTATGMAWALTQSGFSRTLAEAMTGLPGGSLTFMAASIAAFMILGSVLEGIPSIVLFGPLLFPIARAVGIHEVHYAMVVILAMGIGLFAPPFGVGYYTACAIGRIDPAEGLRAIWPYMLSLLLGLALVAAIPWISIGFLR
jgi:tripartite ATP-independent transporter DctM subunit